MPGSILDLFAAAAGHPDPADQIAARLGQMPGQPGSPQGPQPLAGAVPPAGAPAGPGGPPGASGGPPSPGGPGGAAPPPPQPQATQTPPDLGQMFVQLMQRQQADQGFNRGLGMLAAGFAQPRDRATMIDAMSQGGPDAGSLMGNLMKLQQFNVEQQQMQRVMAAAPSLAVQLFGEGADKDPTKMAQAQAIIASGKYGDIEANLAGVGGSPAWQAQKKAENALTAAGKPIPWTPGDPSSYNAWTTADITEKKQAAEDIGNAKDSFSTMSSNYKNLRDNMAWINAHPDAVVEALTTMSPTGGMLGKAAGAVNAVSPEALTAAQKLALLNTQLYASNFRGTKQRLSQAEAQRLGDQFTTLNKGAINMAPGDIKAEIGRLSDQIDTGAANVYAAAGQEIPANLADKPDKIYTNPTSSLYAYGNKPVQIEKPPAGSPAPTPPVPGAAPASGTLKPLSTDDLAQAKANIVKYGRDVVIAHLKANNYDTSGL